MRQTTQLFEKRTLRRIRSLQRRVCRVTVLSPGMQHFLQELHTSLDGKFILAPLVLVSVILENCVRELLIRSRATIDAEGDLEFRAMLVTDLEEFFEEHKNPPWYLPKMVDELVATRILRKRIGEELKQYYRDVRVPLHHGLLRRLCVGAGKEWLVEVFGRQWRYRSVEEVIVDHGVDLLERGMRHVEQLGRAAKRIGMLQN